MSKLLERPENMRFVCETLLNEMPIPTGTRFVGSAIGGIQFAHEYGALASAPIAFTEKVSGSMELVRFSISAHESVVVVEDVLTSGSTTLKTIDACERAGAKIFPVVLVGINRSTVRHILGPNHSMYGIMAFAEIEGKEWLPEDCPLCRQGSVAKKPKAHWNEFFPH